MSNETVPSVRNSGLSEETKTIIPRPQPGVTWTTLPSATLKEKIRAVNLATKPGRPAEDVIGQEILVTDVLLKGVQIADKQSGEVHDCILCLLIPPSGDAVQCVSWGVVGSLETIAAFFGRPPWKPALVCKLSQLRTKGKMMVYQLEMVRIHNGQ